MPYDRLSVAVDGELWVAIAYLALERRRKGVWEVGRALYTLVSAEICLAALKLAAANPGFQANVNTRFFSQPEGMSFTRRLDVV